MWRPRPIPFSISARKAFHEIEVWAVPERIEIFAARHSSSWSRCCSKRFGRQPPLPEWVYSGAIVGLKDGERLLRASCGRCEAGVEVSALWCEDWVGLRQTSFGARLFWDWQANEARYPGLSQRIAELDDDGIRFLGYVNPYLCVDGPLFQIADAAGYFATDRPARPR